jgi:hypothetical protein
MLKDSKCEVLIGGLAFRVIIRVTMSSFLALFGGGQFVFISKQRVRSSLKNTHLNW